MLAPYVGAEHGRDEGRHASALRRHGAVERVVDAEFVVIIPVVRKKLTTWAWTEQAPAIGVQAMRDFLVPTGCRSQAQHLLSDARTQGDTIRA